MLKKTLILLACAATLALAQDEAERVPGAGLVTPGVDLQDLFCDLMAKSISAEEVEMFSGCVDGMAPWAAANGEAWGAIEGTEDPVKAIVELGVWEVVDLTAQEFVALLLKLSAAQRIAADILNPDEIRQSADFFRTIAEDESLPAEDRENAARTVAGAEKMIAALQAYPEANVELYRSHQAKIDAALERFETLGPDEDAPPKEGDGMPEDGGR